MIFNGQRLRQLREQKLWSKLELAKRLNVSDPQIGRWEQMVCVPRGAMIRKLSRVLGVPVAELMVSEEKESVGA